MTTDTDLAQTWVAIWFNSIKWILTFCFMTDILRIIIDVTSAGIPVRNE